MRGNPPEQLRDTDLLEQATEEPPVASFLPGTEGGRNWLPGGCALLDSQGNIIEADSAFLNWLGTGENQRGKPFGSVLCKRHPHWEARITEFLAQPAAFSRVELTDCADQPAQWYTLETAHTGGTRYMRLSSSLPPISERGEHGWDATLSSEAAQRQMYLRLTRAEAQLTNLGQRWPGVIFSQRPDLSFQFVNDRITDWTGISVAEWQRDPQRLRDVIHECDDGELQQQLKRSATTPGGSTATFRIRHIQSGRVTYVREHRDALISQSGLLLGYEGIWLDVSRQTIAERRLSSASWMETLAVLTAGLAHDFSNVIAGVQALSETFQAQLPLDHPFQEGLGLIKISTQNAIQIVRRILSLHQGKVGERAYHDLNELVKELIELVRITIPRRIQLQVHLDPAALPVYADAVELRQVFVNLVLNAVEAMPEHGKLTIRTTRHDQSPPATNLRGTLPAGPCVCLQVRDEGMGIPARHLETIFDPFFTTKPGNKGSGLGLYNARLFAEKHRGALSVESKENVGTSFCLWLPQSDFTEADPERQQPRHHRHTLLLLGPAEKCVDEIASALRQQGHYVVTVPDAENPRELLSSPNYEFSAVLALVTRRDAVPEQLFNYLRVRKLRVKTILLIVGCDRDEFTAQSLKHADLVMAAETSAPELLAKVNTLLNEAAALPQP